jgi:hypothetical protein
LERRPLPARETENPLPPLLRADGTAKIVPLELAIAIICAPDFAMLTREPFLTAEPPEKFTLLKLSKAMSPVPSLGISSTHSADDRDDLYLTVVL